MKIIYTAKEFGAMQDMVDSIIDKFNTIEEVEVDEVSLVEAFEGASINVLPDGSVEVENDEEFMLALIAFYENRFVSAVPLMYKLADLIDPMVNAIKAVFSILNKNIVDDIKSWFKSTEESFEKLVDDYSNN